MDENKNPLKDSFDKSAIGLAVKLIREVWEKNRKLIYIDLIITAAIAIAGPQQNMRQNGYLTCQKVSALNLVSTMRNTAGNIMMILNSEQKKISDILGPRKIRRD